MVLCFRMNWKRIRPPLVVAKNFRYLAAEPARRGNIASARRARPTKYHRYNSIESRLLVQICRSKPRIRPRMRVLSESAEADEPKDPSSSCLISPTKYHRYISIESRSLVQIRRSKPSIRPRMRVLSESAEADEPKDPSSSCLISPTKYHRYNSTETRSLVQIRRSKLFMFNALQKSAHLVENKQLQIDCFQSVTHSLSLFFCKSRLMNLLRKTYPGVYPLSQLDWRRP